METEAGRKAMKAGLCEEWTYRALRNEVDLIVLDAITIGPRPRVPVVKHVGRLTEFRAGEIQNGLFDLRGDAHGRGRDNEIHTLGANVSFEKPDNQGRRGT